LFSFLTGQVSLPCSILPPPPTPTFYGGVGGGGTTWVSWCQKRTSGLYGARED